MLFFLILVPLSLSDLLTVLPSFEGTWASLSQVAVKVAQFISRERQPYPKCLEGTWADLLKYIHRSLDEEEKDQLIWLHGTAGVGKFAIAFTVAKRIKGLKVTKETSVEKRLAGFFFSRKHTKRCTTGHLFATYAYQLANKFPSIRKDVSRVIRDNPALLHTVVGTTGQGPVGGLGQSESSTRGRLGCGIDGEPEVLGVRGPASRRTSDIVVIEHQHIAASASLLL
jgi:hypothetical protein